MGLESACLKDQKQNSIVLRQGGKLKKQKKRQMVNSNDPSLTLSKSKSGKISARNTESKEDYKAFYNDPTSFLLSISRKLRYSSIDPKCNGYKRENEWPNFGFGGVYISECDKLNRYYFEPTLPRNKFIEYIMMNRARVSWQVKMHKFTFIALETSFIFYW